MADLGTLPGQNATETLTIEVDLPLFSEAVDLNNLADKIAEYQTIYTSLLGPERSEFIGEQAEAMLDRLIQNTTPSVVPVDSSDKLTSDQIESLKDYASVKVQAQEALEYLSKYWENDPEGRFESQLEQSITAISQYTAVVASLQELTRDQLIEQVKDYIELGASIVNNHIESQYEKGLVEETIYQNNELTETSYKLMTDLEYALQTGESAKGFFDTEENLVYLRLSSDMSPLEVIINTVHESIHYASATDDRVGFAHPKVDEAAVEKLTYDLVLQNKDLIFSKIGCEQDLDELFDVYNEQMDSLNERIEEVNQASREAFNVGKIDYLPEALNAANFTTALFSKDLIENLKSQVSQITGDYDAFADSIKDIEFS